MPNEAQRESSDLAGNSPPSHGTRGHQVVDSLMFRVELIFGGGLPALCILVESLGDIGNSGHDVLIPK